MSVSEQTKDKDKDKDKERQREKDRKNNVVLLKVRSFVEALTYPDEDGRVLISIGFLNSFFSYFLKQ